MMNLRPTSGIVITFLEPTSAGSNTSYWQAPASRQASTWPAPFVM